MPDGQVWRGKCLDLGFLGVCSRRYRLKQRRAFVSAGDFGKSAICRFADSVGIDAGIVVGRLQKEGFIAFNRFRELKTKYEITA
ncbi:MAG: hypothetical protein IKK03_05950 [Lachnospiraceae bacterium]|nr:hypothetical protein [Lachnospiraceae bacterium]